MVRMLFFPGNYLREADKLAFFGKVISQMTGHHFPGTLGLFRPKIVIAQLFSFWLKLFLHQWSCFGINVLCSRIQKKKQNEVFFNYCCQPFFQFLVRTYSSVISLVLFLFSIDKETTISTLKFLRKHKKLFSEITWLEHQKSSNIRLNFWIVVILVIYWKMFSLFTTFIQRSW